MRGWHNEPQRHSLAARGILTRSKGLIKPSGEPDIRKVEHLTRTDRSIEGLGRVLSTGRMDYTDFDVYGGLTSIFPIDEDSNIFGGWVILDLDPEVVFKENDIIMVDYTLEFFKKNPGIGDRVRGNITAVWEPGELVDYKDEKELVSYSPIKISSEAVRRIEIHYGDDIVDPITGNDEESTPWEPGSEKHLHMIFKVIEHHIPRRFWDRTYVVGNEGEYRVGDYVIK